MAGEARKLERCCNLGIVYVIGRVRKSRLEQLDLIGTGGKSPGGSQAFGP